ncbi:MAG TPA: MarR family transcriptional regulator [Steroidobacteraceae bacterium]
MHSRPLYGDIRRLPVRAADPGKSSMGNQSPLHVRKGTSLTSSRRKRSLKPARSGLDLRTLQAFRMIFGSARRFDADVRRSTGVSGSLLWALSEIARTRSMSVNALAERMALHQTTASNVVNALVEQKLIRRTRSARDHRVVQLEISAAGKQMLASVQGPHAGLLVDAIRRLDIAQLGSLQRGLAQLVEQMRTIASVSAGETLMGE